jgi:hypothetical protein
VALIKDTRFGTRGSEFFTLQARAEFFNVSNLVNFGLPANHRASLALHHEVPYIWRCIRARLQPRRTRKANLTASAVP